MKFFANKYIAGALIFCSTAFGFQSCSLDEVDHSGEGADEVFATPQGMEYLVNQMYYWLRAKYFGREDPVLYMEGSTDLWQNIGTKYEYGMQMTRCVDLQGDRGQIAGVWDRIYDDVNNANAILERLPDCKGLTEEQKKDFEGEARFIRAYSYWWLVEFFGDIELRTEETKSPSFSAVRTDLKKIYDDVIIRDAKIAADNLPVDPYKGNVGRPTKKAALNLLARVCLTRASYEAQGSTEQAAFYEQALAAAKDLIDHKYGVVTYDTYDEIWQAKNNKTNTEYLWVNTFSSNQNLDADSKPNRLHMYYSPYFLNRPGIGSTPTWDYPKESTLVMPTYYFLNLWEDWDARYDAVFQEDFMNGQGSVYKWGDEPEWQLKYKLPQQILDARVKKTGQVFLFTKKHLTDAQEIAYAEEGIATVDIDKLYKTEAVNQYGGAPIRNCNANYGEKESTEEIASSFPRFRKFRIWDGKEDGTILLQAANGQFGYADASIMRYAEAPLIAAECLIALNRQPEAAQIINSEIRTQRVVKPGYHLSDVQVTADDMTLDWIMDERARELCGEYLRWFDCKRVYGTMQHKFAETINGRNPSMSSDPTKGNQRQEYHTLWPIPNTFLDKLTNPQEFGQNPGYTPFIK